MKKLLTHTILDSATATHENIQLLTELNKTGTSLYRGRSEEQLAEVAPYLFEIPESNEFLEKILADGKGLAWGIFIISKSSFDELFKHFRKFLIVKTEEGKELYFRFYDPRVLRIFLPSCDAIQLKDFFGPVTQFFVEDNDPDFGIRYWLENNILKQDRFDMATWSRFSENIVHSPTESPRQEKPTNNTGPNPWL